jgi:hypothetical protein
VTDAFNGMADKVQSLRTVLDQAKNAGLFESGPVRLSDAYGRLFGELRARYDSARAIEDEIKQLLDADVSKLAQNAPGVLGLDRYYRLFKEIREKLKTTLAELEGRFKGTLSDKELAELRTMDDDYLADRDTNAVQFLERWTMYDNCVNKASPGITYAQTLSLVGEDWKPLNDILKRIADLRVEVQGYKSKGNQGEKAVSIATYCLNRAERVHSDEFIKVYYAQSREKLRAQLRFPLVGSVADLQAPLESSSFKAITSQYKQPLIEMRQNLSRLDPMINALVTEQKQVRGVTVVLMSRGEQLRLSGQQIGMDAFKQIELRVGTVDHALGVQAGAAGRLSTDSPTDRDIARFTLHEAFHFHFYRNPTDSAVSADMPAPTNWTSLRLLDQQNARRIGDGKRWQFALQPGDRKLVWIEFRFEAPFPEFNDWPTFRSIGLDNSRRP